MAAFRVFLVSKEKLPIAQKIAGSEEFKMQGYKLVTAQSLGLPGEVQYLYVEGDDAFFKRIFDKLTYFTTQSETVPSQLKELDELKGAEAEQVAEKIKKQDEQAQEGLGFIFS